MLQLMTHCDCGWHINLCYLDFRIPIVYLNVYYIRKYMNSIIKYNTKVKYNINIQNTKIPIIVLMKIKF